MKAILTILVLLTSLSGFTQTKFEFLADGVMVNGKKAKDSWELKHYEKALGMQASTTNGDRYIFSAEGFYLERMSNSEIIREIGFRLNFYEDTPPESHEPSSIYFRNKLFINGKEVDALSQVNDINQLLDEDGKLDKYGLEWGSLGKCKVGVSLDRVYTVVTGRDRIMYLRIQIQ